MFKKVIYKNISICYNKTNNKLNQERSPMDNKQNQDKEQAIAELRRDVEARLNEDYESARCEAYYENRRGWDD